MDEKFCNLMEAFLIPHHHKDAELDPECGYNGQGDIQFVSMSDSENVVCREVG